MMTITSLDIFSATMQLSETSREGKTMTTLDDVARLAGVSRMTVSNALRGKSNVKDSTADKVVKAARKLHYRPNFAARSLASGKTNIIGFSTVELDHSPFSVNLASAISDKAFERGYQTMIQQTRKSEQYESTMFSDSYMQICEGTIFSAPTLSAAEITSLSQHYPLVAFDAPELVGTIDTVLSPYEQGSQAAVEHLIAKGARRILILGPNYRDRESLKEAKSLDGLRLKGAAEALHRHGLDYGPSSVIRCEWNYQAAYAAMTAHLDSTGRQQGNEPDFDAVFCLSDVIAIGAMRAIDQAGIRIPEQVCIIGFDGLQETQYANPPISTISIGVQETAENCVDLLLRRIESHEAQVKQQTVPFTLVERKSSARR